LLAGRYGKVEFDMMQTGMVKTGHVFDARATNLSLRTAAEALFRQKRLFLSVASTVMFLAIAVSVLMPRQYVSEMKFLVQNARGNVVVTPERTNAQNVASDVTETQVNSELEILRSHDVLDPVADPGWEKVPVSQRTPELIREHEGLLAGFDKKLETEPVRKTNVIDVRYRASTPDEANNSLQRLSQVYLEHHRRMQRPTGASAFFASEAERYRKAWDEASRQLVEFQQQHQLYSLAQRETDLEAKITKAQDDLLVSDAGVKELDARLAESTRRMRGMSMRQTTQNRAGPNLQSVQQLTALVIDLENKRTALVTNYKPEDRMVRELDQQIASTRAALNDAAATKPFEVTTDVDPAWQQVRTEYAQGNISRRAAGARRAAVGAQLGQLKQDLAGMQDLNVQFNNLEAQVKERQQNYELYAEKRDQSQISDAMDDRGLMNVVVAQRPTFSYLPARPKPLTNAVLGMVTALFLGLCTVYLAEAGRNTVATPRELEAASRYPVLATLPVMSPQLGEVVEGTEVERERALRSIMVRTTRPPDMCSYQ
jgi:uncharacterized protein involved in exopolysaccharide biosynthesis